MKCRVCKRSPCVYRPRRRKNDAAEDLEFPPRPKAKSLARQKGGRRAAEHRAERDEAVAVNLDAHELAAWDREKRRFKGTPEARLRAFRQWVHEHPRETLEATERESDAKLARMIREHERARTVAVPCETPYRVRTKELCDMAKRNPRKRRRKNGKAAIVSVSVKNPRKKRRKKNASPFESRKDRQRRLSDERLRKAAEKRSRASKKGDATRARRRTARNPGETTRAKRHYTLLHWGRKPEGEETFYVSSTGGKLVVMGELARVEYVTKKGDEPTTIYEHDFRRGTFLLVNSLGELVIAKKERHGGYRVTEAGIVG